MDNWLTAAAKSSVQTTFSIDARRRFDAMGTGEGVFSIEACRIGGGGRQSKSHGRPTGHGAWSGDGEAAVDGAPAPVGRFRFRVLRDWALDSTRISGRCSRAFQSRAG
jgi:hypothetical protein